MLGLWVCYQLLVSYHFQCFILVEIGAKKKCRKCFSNPPSPQARLRNSGHCGISQQYKLSGSARQVIRPHVLPLVQMEVPVSVQRIWAQRPGWWRASGFSVWSITVYRLTVSWLHVTTLELVCCLSWQCSTAMNCGKAALWSENPAWEDSQSIRTKS